MAKSQINFGELGGGGVSDSGTITLTANTDETISLSFEPKVVVCKFSYSTSDYIVDTYAYDVNSSKQYVVRTDNSARISNIPVSSDEGLGGLIQSVSSSGFVVRANNSYKNLDWIAYG